MISEEMQVSKEFDEWWELNEEQFMNDSLHMSTYHMASIVWQAAIKSAGEITE
jgi:hypothetical protein